MGTIILEVTAVMPPRKFLISCIAAAFAKREIYSFLNVNSPPKK